MEVSDVNLELVEGQTQFALELYDKIRDRYDPSSNLTILPLSVTSNILHINIGAKRKTRREIQNTFHLPTIEQVKNKDHEAFLLAQMIRKLETLQPKSMVCRDTILVDEIYPMTKKFKKISASYFCATKVKSVNFKKSNNSLRSEMDRTGHRRYDLILKKSRPPVRKINDLSKVLENSFKPPLVIRTPVMDPLSSLAIVNGASLICKFDTEFKLKKTKLEPFSLSSSKQILVKTMNTTGLFRVGDFVQLDARILEIPLEDQWQNLYIVLPNKTDGLPELENKLINQKELQEWSSLVMSLRVKLVHVSLPRFYDQTSVDMMRIYRKLGVTHLTDKKRADLQGVSKKKGLSLSEHMLVCQIKIDESGAKRPLSKKEREAYGQDDMVNFAADHPFLFVIADPIHHSILCIGRLATPEKKFEKSFHHRVERVQTRSRRLFKYK